MAGLHCAFGAGGPDLDRKIKKQPERFHKRKSPAVFAGSAIAPQGDLHRQSRNMLKIELPYHCALRSLIISDSKVLCQINRG
jgi:hypothetical protein